MSPATPTVTRSTALFGLSPSGFVSLAAVLAVLLVVSLPRLRDMARLENEGDARATAELLVRAIAPLEGAGPDARLATLADRGSLTRGLADGEWLESGRVLRRHGYLFELCTPPAPLQAASLSLALTGSFGAERPRFAVRAWPWSGDTGQRVFVASDCGTVLAHSNREARWQGLERPPRASELSGWQRLP